MEWTLRGVTALVQTSARPKRSEQDTWEGRDMKADATAGSLRNDGHLPARRRLFSLPAQDCLCATIPVLLHAKLCPTRTHAERTADQPRSWQMALSTQTDCHAACCTLPATARIRYSLQTGFHGAGDNVREGCHATYVCEQEEEERWEGGLEAGPRWQWYC